MHFLLTRPQIDNDRLAVRLTALGHQVTCDPLLHIKYAPSDLIPETSGDKVGQNTFQAILFTSANGVRAYGHHHRHNIKESLLSEDLPCYAVGAATAMTAWTLGFSTVIEAGGNVDELGEAVSQNLQADAGPLLHIAGKHVAGDLAGRLVRDGFQIITQKLYHATKSTALSAESLDMLRAGAISHMPFYSPRTAKTFLDLACKAGIENSLTKTTVLCLSSAITDVISCLHWREILTATHPDQDTMFQMIDINVKGPRQ